MINIDNEFIELISNSKPSEMDEMISKAKVDFSEILEPPPVCYEFIDDNESFRVGSLGDFSCIIGKAKSRKSFLMSMILASALRNDPLMNFMNTTPPRAGMKIILFDTEQARHKVQQIQQRIYKLAQCTETNNLIVFSLRQFDPFQRLKFIEYVLSTISDIFLVVIDGIRDLVFNINNEEEATRISTNLLRWTTERNIHILTILHQNKGDNNARGHLGTEIINKAETIMSVTIQADQKEISIVEAEFCREKPFNPFAFSISPEGLPYIVDDWSPKDTQRKKFDLFAIDQKTHVSYINEILPKGERLKYSELYQSIKLIYAKNGIEIGDNKAKAALTFYKNENYITQSGSDYISLV